MEDRIRALRKKALALPLLPGVYIMRDAHKEIIYIGKAKALKNRVSQYFTNIDKHLEKVRQMVLHVADFDYILCDSEFEALVLEASLIKQNQPKYNILLKDDKGYHYIHVSDEDWKRISAEKSQKPGGRNIGPYNSGYMVRQAVEQAKRVYGLPMCNKHFSDDMKKTRPCLNYYIGLCKSPCSGRMKKAEYLEAVEGALEFIKKGSENTVAALQQQMEQASDNLEFEKAAKLRDRIAAIRNIQQKQKMVDNSGIARDVIAFVEGQKTACFEVFRFRGGQLSDREHFFVDPSAHTAAAASQFLTQYYSMRSDLPKIVMMAEPPESPEVLQQWLQQRAKHAVRFVYPQRGEQKQLLELCRTNAAERVAQKEGLSIRQTAVLDELRGLTGLKTAPRYIEAYDISHTAGSETVAGMVVFKDGRPYKNGYRRFAINGDAVQDDYASMAQVLTRRLREYQKHIGETEGFGVLPDLILLDGGAGQLHAVLPVLQQAGVDVPVFGMVKDAHHKTRALVGRQGEIAIKATRSVFTLISSIQDEVHRFAIGYHHQKHRANALAMQLTSIEGIGEKRAKALLRTFRDINKIACASVEQLRQVPGMNEAAARKVYAFYH